MKDLLFLEWVCVRVDLWHLKNCQKIGSVYFSNFQKIISFKRSVYRVRVSVGPCIFLIPFETYCGVRFFMFCHKIFRVLSLCQMAFCNARIIQNCDSCFLQKDLLRYHSILSKQVRISKEEL